MTCKNCNTTNSTNAQFCRSCGQSLVAPVEQKRGSVDTYFAKQTRGCQVCHSLAPTKNVNFYQLIGAVVMMRYSSIKGRLCKRCSDKEFKTRTMTTLLLGWWGAIS